MVDKLLDTEMKINCLVKQMRVRIVGASHPLLVLDNVNEACQVEVEVSFEVVSQYLLCRCVHAGNILKCCEGKCT